MADFTGSGYKFIDNDASENNDESHLTPAMKQLRELDKHIIGQDDAKRALIRLTNCADRRLQVTDEIKEAIRPFHAIFSGPTGSGKSALVECHAKNKGRPYIKTEATRYTEVGYVGRDVESMARDLVENARAMVEEWECQRLKPKAEAEAKEKVVNVLVGEGASDETRRIFMEKIQSGEIDQREIEIEVRESPKGGGGIPMDMMGGGAAMGFINIGDLLSKAMGKRNNKNISVTVKEALALLVDECLGEMMDEDKINHDAVKLAESRGIIFIDEVDKIASRADMRGGEVNREGVQRDLLPILDGTVVNTKYGAFRTHHVLFIAAGSFHNAKLSDLLPELQGRFPVRVRLNSLTYEDFVKILRNTKYSLLKQHTAMLAVDDVDLHFTNDGIEAIAAMTVAANRHENTGARRLRSIIDLVLHDINFDSAKYKGRTIYIDSNFVNENVNEMRNELDLSRFVL